MYIRKSDIANITHAAGVPNKRSDVSVFTVPNRQKVTIPAPGREYEPFLFRLAQKKMLTNQNLTGSSTVTVTLDAVFPRPGFDGWANKDGLTAIAYIFADGGSPSAANRVSVTTFNYEPINSVVLSVPAGQQTTGRTIVVYALVGVGDVQWVVRRKDVSGITREFGPYEVASVSGLIKNDQISRFSKRPWNTRIELFRNDQLVLQVTAPVATYMFEAFSGYDAVGDVGYFQIPALFEQYSAR